MGRSFAQRANRVIERADVVLEIIDARFPNETRNFNAERKAESLGKKLVIVANKSDLVGFEKAEKVKMEIGKERCVFMSAKERSGKKKLLQAIGKISGQSDVTVGVIGYPNTGKSSIINLLRGRRAALTSKQAGFTKGEQFVRIDKNIMVIDSPGVIPPDERDEFKLFLVNAKNPQDVQDVELVAIKVIGFLCSERKGALKKRYGVEENNDPEETLKNIAIFRKKLLKHGLPDIMAAARIVLEDWRNNILA